MTFFFFFFAMAYKNQSTEAVRVSHSTDFILQIRCIYLLTLTAICMLAACAVHIDFWTFDYRVMHGF